MSAPISAVVPEISPELLLAVFDLPVSFHRCLIPITGGVAPALMLSQAIWTTQELDAAAEGWFSASEEEWTRSVGLSRAEQDVARRALCSAGFLEAWRAGPSAACWYRVRAQAVWAALREHAAGRSHVGRETGP